MRCFLPALSSALVVILAACTAPSDPALPHLREAEAALAEGRPVLAADAYQLALAAAPGDLRALRGLLDVRVAAGDAEGALLALEALEARDPEPVDPCPVLALATIEGSGEAREALARRAVAAGCIGASRRLAQVLTDEATPGGGALAIASLLEAIELDPSDPSRFRYAAELLIEAGRVGESIALLATGLEKHPDDRSLSDLMVRALSIR